MLRRLYRWLACWFLRCDPWTAEMALREEIRQRRTAGCRHGYEQDY